MSTTPPKSIDTQKLRETLEGLLGPVREVGAERLYWALQDTLHALEKLADEREKRQLIQAGLERLSDLYKTAVHERDLGTREGEWMRTALRQHHEYQGFRDGCPLCTSLQRGSELGQVFATP